MSRILFLPALFLTLIPGPAVAETLHVPSEYPTIQVGIDSASVGDTVLVAEGFYDGGIDFDGKDLVLLSEDGPLSTIINCNGSGRGFHFHSGETGQAVVEGFTIWAARVEGDYGGGMRFENGSSPTITWCLIAACEALNGGAVYCDDASPSFVNCTISKNQSYERFGGVIYCTGNSSLWLVRTVVLENWYWSIELEAGSSVAAACCAWDQEEIARGQGDLTLVGEQVFGWCGWCGEQPTVAPPLQPDPWYFTIYDGSQCRAEASPCGELIGAFGVMCDYYPVEEVTWGRIKGRFRE
jgi:predicted outer membrane repeat protein